MSSQLNTFIKWSIRMQSIRIKVEHQTTITKTVTPTKPNSKDLSATFITEKWQMWIYFRFFSIWNNKKRLCKVNGFSMRRTDRILFLSIDSFYLFRRIIRQTSRPHLFSNNNALVAYKSALAQVIIHVISSLKNMAAIHHKINAKRICYKHWVQI